MRNVVVVGVVAVPDTTPVVEFSDKPLGNVPELMLHVKGLVPPVTNVLRSNEYATPTVAGGKLFPGGGVNTADGLTVTLTEADFVESATEVAATVTSSLDATMAGAWYMLAVPLTVVLCAIIPQEDTPAGQATVQETPFVKESLVTVAVTALLCP